MLMRVPKVTSLLTLINIGLPISVRSNTNQQRDPFCLLCIHIGKQTSCDVHSITLTTPVDILDVYMRLIHSGGLSVEKSGKICNSQFGEITHERLRPDDFEHTCMISQVSIRWSGLKPRMYWK